MSADDILITGPDSFREGLAYALERAGLPADPRKVIGRKFSFFARNVGDTYLLLSGTIVSISSQKGTLRAYMAGPPVVIISGLINECEYLDHFEWRKDHWWAMDGHPDPRLPWGYPGEFTLLGEK